MARPRNGSSEPRWQLIRPLAVLIGMIWGAAAVVGLLTGSYGELEVVSAPFLLLCGYVFGAQVIRTATERPPPGGEGKP